MAEQHLKASSPRMFRSAAIDATSNLTMEYLEEASNTTMMFPIGDSYSDSPRVLDAEALLIGRTEGGIFPDMSNYEPEWTEIPDFVAAALPKAQSDENQSSNGDLQFVTESGTARPNGSSRKLIRSQARRKAHKPGDIPRKKSKAPRDLASEWINVSTQAERDKSRDSGTDSSKTLIVSSAVSECHLTCLPLQVLDPFTSTSLGSQGKTQMLMHHYDSFMAKTYAPMNPRTEWLPFALTDPALLHATLSISAMNLCMLQGRLLNPEAKWHKDEAIRLINEALRKGKSHRISNSMLCTVACLAQFENLMGKIAGAKLHMDGLEALVRSQGGIEAMDANSIARKHITWVDCTASIVLNTRPRFVLPTMAIDDPADWGVKTLLATRYQAKLERLTQSPGFSRTTIEISWGLRNLSSLKEINTRTYKQVEFEAYSDMLERLERRTVSLVQSDELKNCGDNMKIYLLFGNAALLHIYMFMRDLPRKLPFLHAVASRILDIFESEGVDLMYLQMVYPELILWTLMMAGLGGMGAIHRTYFANLVAEICRTLGLRGVEEVRTFLGDFLWSEMYRSPVTAGFWADVAAAQEVDEGFEVRKLADNASVAIFNSVAEIEV